MDIFYYRHTRALTEVRLEGKEVEREELDKRVNRRVAEILFVHALVVVRRWGEAQFASGRWNPKLVAFHGPMGHVMSVVRDLPAPVGS